VVAYALAGNVLVDLVNEPRRDKEGRTLKGDMANDGGDQRCCRVSVDRYSYQKLYSDVEHKNELWNEILRWRRGVRMGHHLHLHPGASYFESFSRSPDQVVDIINAHPWQCLEIRSPLTI